MFFSRPAALPLVAGADPVVFSKMVLSDLLVLGADTVFWAQALQSANRVINASGRIRFIARPPLCTCVCIINSRWKPPHSVGCDSPLLAHPRSRRNIQAPLSRSQAHMRHPATRPGRTPEGHSIVAGVWSAYYKSGEYSWVVWLDRESKRTGNYISDNTRLKWTLHERTRSIVPHNVSGCLVQPGL